MNRSLAKQGADMPGNTPRRKELTPEERSEANQARNETREATENTYTQPLNKPREAKMEKLRHT